MYNLLLEELKESKRKKLKETYERGLRLIEAISYPSLEELILHNSSLLKSYPEFNLMYIKKFVKYYSLDEAAYTGDYDEIRLYKGDERMTYSESLLDSLLQNIKPEDISFEILSDEHGDTIKILNSDISIFIPGADD